VDKEKQQSGRIEPKQFISRCHGRHFLHVLSFADSDVFATGVDLNIGSYFTRQARDDELKLGSHKQNQLFSSHTQKQQQNWYPKTSLKPKQQALN